MFKSWDEFMEMSGPFDPGPHINEPMKILSYQTEDVTTVSVMVNGAIDLLRHGTEPRYVGITIWLSYNPQMLLADMR